MDRKARYPFRWFGLLTPLGVLLTVPLGTAPVPVRLIDDKRQPEPSDPSADYDDPADKAGALNAILSMAEANADSFEAFAPEKPNPATPAARNALPSVALETVFPSQYSAALPIFRNGDGVGPHVTVKK